MPEPRSYPKCFGPYLRYAISTDFRNFEFFDLQSALFFLVEFKTAEKDQHRRFVDDVAKAHGGAVDLSPPNGTRYATMFATKSAVAGEALDVWDRFVSRVELSLPLKPKFEPGVVEREMDRRENGDDPVGPLLLGVIDDGCPFAAAHFLKSTSGVGRRTRVRGIWDQNFGRQPINVNDKDGQPCVFGKTLGDLKYGLEFRRASDAPGAASPRQMGLNEWIELHVTPQGSVDEDGCYADAGFPCLAHHASHGAHVMDLFAGRIPTSSRIGPFPGDRRDPPSWSVGADAASQDETDVVFVQFPTHCLRDATGVWLKAYVHDAILYILSHVDSTKPGRVVINLSYGPTTGPHNGLAELETLLTTFVEKYDGEGKLELDIVIAAGNSYLLQDHVTFCRTSGQPDHVEWTWRLPPDNTSLCFAEVWMKTAYAAPVEVTLISPSGVQYKPTAPPLPLPTPLPPTPPAGVDVPIPWTTEDTMWRLHVEPTIATDEVVAEHGDWTIQVAKIPEGVELHAYVARTDPNMNMRTGAKRSYFVDGNWERARSAEDKCTYTNGEFNRTGSLIDRHGTLNGIATAKDDGVHVAGGFIISNRRKSRYSSAGPARPGPLTRRYGPDYLLPCDESYALGGIRAGGNRSGAVFRLTGTSTAAPQLARHIAKPPAQFPQATDVPSPGDYVEIEKRGGGNLEPP
ncbi:hypothetical protein [Bradyrhizobium algeriense]|uniref:hypothetical protein n=1 Tax=Bradyrhizobium algeriense TaxID=634784 RepID=UPI000D3ABDC8|nr:hypothetical protein [Bradyrhizobium algeriense]